MLGAFAVAQPLLSDFREGAGYFVARRNQPIEIVLLVVVLIFIPGLIASLVVWAADAFSDRVRFLTFLVFVGLFSSLIAHTSLVRLTSVNWVVLLALSLAIGVVAAMAQHRSKWFRTFLRYLIPAPLIFGLFFLLTPPVSGLVFPTSSGAAISNITSEAPVIFIVFDEFPVTSLLDSDGQIDTARYPNFAKLASISTWYKYTASAHDGTLWALPALLAAQKPDNSLLPTFAAYPGNLFTILDRSHALHVTEPFTQLCPPEMCGAGRPVPFWTRVTGLMEDAVTLYALMVTPDPSEAASVSDPFDEFNAGRADRLDQEMETDQVAQFAEFLRGITTSGPELHFLHLFLPHSPFRYYPSTTQYNNGAELAGHESGLWVEPVLADQAYQRHLLQVQAVDVLIGDLLARLENLEILEDALVVVTADHGVSFRPGDQRRTLTESNAYDIGLVPLFIKAPGQDRGAVETVPARTIDVLPTVAAHLEFELPWAHDGRSLLRQPGEAEAPLVQRRSGIQVALDDVEGGLRNATEYVQSRFGAEDGSLDPFSFGDYRSLVGASSDLASSGSSQLTARVDESWRLAHVAPGLGFVPGFLHGQLRGDADRNLQVAVAMNGRISTVVPLYDVEEGVARFSAMLPESSFVPGFNELELFAVSGSPATPVVTTISVSDTNEYAMERSANGDARIVDSTGGSWPILEASPITGFIDQVSWHDAGLLGLGSKDLHMAGWAVDEVLVKPAERIVFFINGVFAGTAGLDSVRPDIDEGYAGDVLFSGFTGKVSQFLPVASLELRAFAVSNGAAEELPMTDTALADLSDG